MGIRRNTSTVNPRCLEHPSLTDRSHESARSGHLIAHLQMTASWLPDEVLSLSQAQLSFRSAPGKWTIAEVVEHLVIAEPNYSEVISRRYESSAPGSQG